MAFKLFLFIIISQVLFLHGQLPLFTDKYFTEKLRKQLKHIEIKTKNMLRIILSNAFERLLQIYSMVWKVFDLSESLQSQNFYYYLIVLTLTRNFKVSWHLTQSFWSNWSQSDATSAISVYNEKREDCVVIKYYILMGITHRLCKTISW